MSLLNRRSFLIATGVTTAGTQFVVSRQAAAAPPAKFHDRRIISQLPHRYHGWPTLTRCANEELLLVCSGGREAHICPFGRVELMRSKDGGETWSWPRVIMDGPIDDRDAGVLVTDKGSILVTTFTSVGYEQSMTEAGTWPVARRIRWNAAHNRLNAQERRAAVGVWMIRSIDGGLSWSSPYDSIVNSPHGPIQLSDGRLLYAGKDLWRGESRNGVCQSTDDGQSWSWQAEIPTRNGDKHQDYHELHAVETTDQRIVVQIRNHNRDHFLETLQTESADGGKTWSQPQPIGVWGLPSHLLRLRDGRLLMTYGHRRPSFGNQARVSQDHGRNWSAPIMISDDGIGRDLGYPSTAQLNDGSLVTVWYEKMKDSSYAVLRQARWSFQGENG